jgi:exonuclease III
VNSVRGRLDRVVEWVQKRDPARRLQETKTNDEDFEEEEAFRNLGYECSLYGQRGGVALLLKWPVTDVVQRFADDDCRRKMRMSYLCRRSQTGAASGCHGQGPCYIEFA